MNKWVEYIENRQYSRELINETRLDKYDNPVDIQIVFRNICPTPQPRKGCYTISIFNQSLTDLNSEFSFF